MRVRVKLHSILRDYLPPQAKGQTTLELPAGATIADLRARLKIERQCVVIVNGKEVSDADHPLRDGDEVQMLMALGGGSG